MRFQLVPPSIVADDPVFLAGQEKFRLSLLKNLARAIKEVCGRVYISYAVGGVQYVHSLGFNLNLNLPRLNYCMQHERERVRLGTAGQRRDCVQGLKMYFDMG